MNRTLKDLDQIVAKTPKHYDPRAQEFRKGSRGHDVSQNVAALLQHIEFFWQLTLRRLNDRLLFGWETSVLEIPIRIRL